MPMMLEGIGVAARKSPSTYMWVSRAYLERPFYASRFVHLVVYIAKKPFQDSSSSLQKHLKSINHLQ
jgi:hypothetical protein